MPKKQTTTPHKKILIAVNSLGEAFKNSLENKSAGVIYIKTIDLKDWATNQDIFITKIFGDRDSNMILNFMYKEDNKEFDRDNLANRILEFKKNNLIISNE